MEYERAILSKLTESASIKQCWDSGLRSSAFEDPLNVEIYEFVIEYWMTNSMELAPTEALLKDEYPKVDLPYADESTTWLIGKLQDRYISNQVQDVMRTAGRITITDPKEALEDLYQGAWEAKQATLPRSNRVNMVDSIQDRRDRYSAQQAIATRGAPIGFPEIDEHSNGILPSEIGLIAGYAKTGKSWAIVNAAIEARRQGFTPVVFSLEQTIPEFEDRIDAVASGVGYGRLSRRELNMEETRQLHASQEALAEFGPLHVERPGRGERTVTNIVNRARQIGGDYVLIDQLSWMESRATYRDRRDEYKELIYDLKEEVSRTSAGEIPCFMAVQYNRASTAKGHSGGMENIANAADIEQTVDMMFGLHRTAEIRANNSMVWKTLGARRFDVKHWLLNWRLNDSTAMNVREEYDDVAT